ncbi:MAG TPA: hypothetical protein VNB90_14350 [Cytophagaceae bacterium]|nr:hypothetical protein [Cytophagaceae bacterium]
MKKYLILVVALITIVLFSNDVQACAMCKETGNQAGGFNAKGLNFGILYLMAIPYIAFSILAYFWYKASKKQKSQDQKIVEILKNSLTEK